MGRQGYQRFRNGHADPVAWCWTRRHATARHGAYCSPRRALPAHGSTRFLCADGVGMRKWLCQSLGNIAHKMGGASGSGRKGLASTSIHCSPCPQRSMPAAMRRPLSIVRPAASGHQPQLLTWGTTRHRSTSGLILAPTNAAVQQLNEMALARLSGESVRLFSR